MSDSRRASDICVARSTERAPRAGTLERVKMDAFFGGICVALDVIGFLDNGRSTDYRELVHCVGPRELLNYARREGDPQLPKIRRAVKWLEERDDESRL